LLIVALITGALWLGPHGCDSNPLSRLISPGAPSAPVQRPPSAAHHPLSRAQLLALSDKVTPSIVDIDTELGYQSAQGAGTGIVLTSDGEVLTNNHVINGATAIAVTDLGNAQTYRAEVVGYDRAKDLAVLRLHGASGLSTATRGDSSEVTVGDAIAAIGNAGGTGGPPTVAGGTVTALDRSVSPTDELTGAAEQLTGLIEVAARVEPGDSGGPLVDRDGRVIGINTAASANYRYQTTGGTGFAIPINSALAVARQIESGQTTDTVHVGRTGILGVRVLSVPANRVELSAPEESPPNGVPVVGVQLGSPAEQAGLSAGNVLTALDGKTVDSATTLINLLGHHHPGDRVTVQWVNATGQQQSATITLIEGPPA
jgi:S1-C subfamily serine protease